MNEHEDQANFAAAAPVERVLDRFRPIGPPPALRQRVLDAALAGPHAAPPRRIALWVWRSAVAAGLVAAVWLSLAGDRIAAQVAGQVGVGPPVWTPQAEETAELLDGQGAGRRYLAMLLQAGPLQPQPTALPEIPADGGLTPSR
jgi:hypothetical protein